MHIHKSNSSTLWPQKHLNHVGDCEQSFVIFGLAQSVFSHELLLKALSPAEKLM